jgi:hypothetical protein
MNINTLTNDIISSAYVIQVLEASMTNDVAKENEEDFDTVEELLSKVQPHLNQVTEILTNIIAKNPELLGEEKSLKLNPLEIMNKLNTEE